jgi:hypothetical protein
MYDYNYYKIFNIIHDNKSFVINNGLHLDSESSIVLVLSVLDQNILNLKSGDSIQLFYNDLSEFFYITETHRDSNSGYLHVEIQRENPETPIINEINLGCYFRIVNSESKIEMRNDVDLNSNSIVLYDVSKTVLFRQKIQITDNSNNPVMVFNTSNKKFEILNNKTFVIPHPMFSDKYLVHSCLEGPESGVYYRGIGEILKSERSTIITLPDYASILAKDFTIHITPMIDFYDDDSTQNSNFYASQIVNNKFKVRGHPGKFFWQAIGKRSSFDVEPNRDDVKVLGNGPYTYIESIKHSKN